MTHFEVRVNGCCSMLGPLVALILQDYNSSPMPGLLLILAIIGAFIDWRYRRKGGQKSSKRDRVLFFASVGLVAILLGILIFLGASAESVGEIVPPLAIVLFAGWELGRWRTRRKHPVGKRQQDLQSPLDLSAAGVPGIADRVPPRERARFDGPFFKVVAGTTLALSIYIVLAQTPFSFLFRDRTIEQSVITESVVNVMCSSSDGQDSGGSGIIVTADGAVITNSHVIPQDQEHLLTPEKGCLVVLPNKENGQPGEMYWARPIVLQGLSEKYDLAYLRIEDVFVDDNGNKRGSLPRTFPSIFAEGTNYDDICRLNGSVRLGDPVRIFGYPQTSGGMNLTVTDGVISSLPDDGTVLTSAKVDAGNSGGLAVDKKGCMVGIPTAVSEGKYQNLGVITSLSKVLDFSDAVSKLNGSK
jgi:S1-C subfamily serine protease